MAWDKQADGLSEEFVSEVSETIKHGQSAIFAMVETRDPDAMAAYFRGTGGNIIRTTLSPYEQERAQQILTGSQSHQPRFLATAVGRTNALVGAEITYKKKCIDMSKLIVITFEGLSQARQARRALDELDREYFDLIDAAVVTKDAYGRVDIDNEVESSTRTGTLIGRLLGAPLAMLFPVDGAVAGAVGGAAVSKAVEPGIEQEFIDQVAETLKLDGSALVFLFDAYEKYELPQVIAMLRPFKSTVYQTTLTMKKALRQALA